MVRAGAPTAGDTYSVEDAERGTWMELLSWKPRAFAIHNFMTKQECDDLIAIAKPMVTRSTVVDSVTGESKVDPIRTRRASRPPHAPYARACLACPRL